MVFVAWEKHLGEFVQALDSGYFVAVKFNLRAWNIFHPYVFD